MNGNEYLQKRCVLPSVTTCICDEDVVDTGHVNCFTHTFFFFAIRSRANTSFGELEEPDLEHSWARLCCFRRVLRLFYSSISTYTVQ